MRHKENYQDLNFHALFNQITERDRKITEHKKWQSIKRSFMQKSFGESMCKETKHNILKFFEEKLR